VKCQEGERMSLQAKMFNRRASNPKNKPDQILETLALQPRQNVADIGAGGGYFSFGRSFSLFEPMMP